jgi:hypothetical protein
MRKTISTLVLTLALTASIGAPTYADDGHHAPPPTQPIPEDCLGLVAADQRVMSAQLSEIFDLQAKGDALAARLADRHDKIVQQRHMIRHQRRVIRHLRADLANG